jgi:hypothetical protein
LLANDTTLSSIIHLIHSLLDEGETGQENIPWIIQIFQAAAKHQKERFIIIDSLDEVSDLDRQILLQNLKALVETKNQVFKIFLTIQANEIFLLKENSINNRAYTSLHMSPSLTL